MTIDLRDPLFKGCTRPAMLAGVPLVAMVLTTCVFALAGSLGSLVLGPASFPAGLAALVAAHSVLKAITRKDDQRLRQWVIRTALWRCDDGKHFGRLRAYGSFSTGRCR
jgi:type IV secretory pathway VirB3-like protein